MGSWTPFKGPLFHPRGPLLKEIALLIQIHELLIQIHELVMPLQSKLDMFLKYTRTTWMHHDISSLVLCQAAPAPRGSRRTSKRNGSEGTDAKAAHGVPSGLTPQKILLERTDSCILIPISDQFVMVPI